MGITQITKRNGETIQLNTNEPFCHVKEATLTSSLMGDDYISLKIVSSNWLSFAKGDKITVGGKEYSIRATTTREIVSEGYYNYEPVFYGVMYDLMKTSYRNCDKNGKSDKSTFDLTYTIKEFVQVLIYNTKRDYPGLWVFDEDNCPETEAKTIQFSGVNCLQALQTLCSSEQFNLEFQITQDEGVRTIHIGKFGKRINPPSGADYFEWGKGNGLYNLKEQKIDDKAIITRLWVEGGTTNIRSNYRDYSERLQLPYPQRTNRYEHTLSDGTVIEAGTETIGIADDAKRYIEDAELRDKIGSEEDVKTYDNIYPTRTGEVTAVVADDICAFIDDTMDFDLNEKEEDGSTKYLVDGTSAKITFTSGRLAGQQFELDAKDGYTHETKKFRIIPFTDNRGLTIPSAGTQDAYKIEVGNTYKITDIYLPESYEQKAEENLWYAAMEDFKTATQAKAQYTLTLDRLYFLQELSRDADTSVFEVGDYVPVKDARFGIEKQMRIQKVTRNLLLEQDYQITLADTTTVSIQTQTVITVMEHDNIINNNRLRDLNKARRGWRTTEDLRNMVYDTDGYFDADNIKPNSIDTNMLTVGAKSQQFVLSGCVLQANVGGNANIFAASAGILSHLTIDNDKIRNWQMSEASFELQSTGGYYLFAKCSKSGETGVWYLTQEQLKFEPDSDPNNYYFQVGIVSNLYADDNFRDFQTTYGFTRINGSTITTGKIVTSDGQCYLDLDGNQFRVGDVNSSLEWANGQLILKGTLVQSQSGDVSYIGVYRGEYNASYTYYNGDEVSYTSDSITSTYRMYSDTPVKGIEPTNPLYWQAVAQGAKGDKGDKGESGTDGKDGNYTEYRYAKNGSTSTAPSLSSTSRTPDGWSTTMPSVAALEYLWMTAAQISGETDTLISNWSTPVRIKGADGTNGKDGADGTNGKDGNTPYIYNNYWYINGTSTGIKAKGTDGADGNTPYIQNGYWYINGTSTGVKAQGTDGATGPLGPSPVYRGTYSSGKTYYGNSKRVDIVKYNSSYYVARSDAGEFSNVVPTNTGKWNSFGAQFESVATDLLFAELAYIDNLGVRNVEVNDTSGNSLFKAGGNAVSIAGFTVSDGQIGATIGDQSGSGAAAVQMKAGRLAVRGTYGSVELDATMSTTPGIYVTRMSTTEPAIYAGHTGTGSDHRAIYASGNVYIGGELQAAGAWGGSLVSASTDISSYNYYLPSSPAKGTICFFSGGNITSNDQQIRVYNGGVVNAKTARAMGKNACFYVYTGRFWQEYRCSF